MSKTVEWITPIYDRTYVDVFEVEDNPLLENAKGCYNATDLNRIENNTKYCLEDMLDRKIIRNPPKTFTFKLDWTNMDIPTRSDMDRIIENIRDLLKVANPIINENIRNIATGTQFNYSLANAIEYDLELLRTQPTLPKSKWLLEIENGIIVEYDTNRAEIEEDEIVHIKGVPYGEYAEYMVFTNWSGDANELQWLGDASEQTTTFRMTYHENSSTSIKFKANFLTRIPRTLTLNNARIYDDIGGSTRTLFAGDRVLILANVAPESKRFYEWQGTEEALDKLTSANSAEDPSTTWLVMPDCDVELTPFYIYAGMHSVIVDNEVQGQYNYNDYVRIQAKSKGEKYKFKSWGGDYTYLLGDVTNSTFRMPDYDVSFTSNWEYIYSYSNVTVFNGTIDGEKIGENLREDSSHQIVANVAPENQGFSHWSIEGEGRIVDPKANDTIFYVGDGNAILTAEYGIIPPSHTVTIENKDNRGEVTSFTVREGDKYNINASEVLSDYMFDYWKKNNSKYSNKANISEIMGTSNVTYEAVYRDRVSYNLTVENGSGSGTYKERSSVTITANPAETGYHFNNWTGDYYHIDNNKSASTSIITPSLDCTTTATYEKDVEIIYHDFTVENGSGSGRYYEGQSIEAVGDKEPSNLYEFDKWYENDEYISSSRTYRTTMGTSDRTIKATYRLIDWFDVDIINGTLEDGTTHGSFMRGSTPTIKMDSAPEEYKFLQWETIEGGENAVTHQFAETTTLKSLSSYVKVKATYYKPDPEEQYTVTITGKTGEIKTYNGPTGKTISVRADSPDEGWEFAYWTGDTQYLMAKENVTNNTVVIPTKDIQLGMFYKKEGTITKRQVIIHGGEFLESTNEDGTEIWSSNSLVEEYATVKLRATNETYKEKFAKWVDADEGKSSSTINGLTTDKETTITIRNFDVELTSTLAERNQYILSIQNGETSGTYYESENVAVYFTQSNHNTDKIQYRFVSWTGSDRIYLKLADGGAFRYDYGGTGDEDAQVIKMPGRHISIVGSYDTYYKLTIIGGTMPEGDGFYKKGDKVNISADVPTNENQRFSHWVGDIQYLENRYLPNTTVTMPQSSIEIKAVYVNKNDRNCIGFVNTELYDTTSINRTNVNLISGEINIGCMIIDTKGHIYTVGNIDGDMLQLMRLTKRGGNENDK